MQRRMLEEPFVMFVTFAVWTGAGLFVGTFAGAAVAVFLRALFWLMAVTLVLPTPVLMVLLPAGGLLSGILIKDFAPEAAGHGTDAVIRAVHLRSGQMGPLVAPVKAVATLITLGSGASAGKEGPSAQIGSAIAALIADLVHLPPEHRRRLVVCGISAGFAAVFATPLAGAVFGIEVLSLGGMLYSMILPCFASSVAAYEVSQAIGVGFSYPVLHLAPVFGPVLFFKVVGLGLGCGLASYLLILLMDKAHQLADRLKETISFTPFITAAGGLCLAILLPITGKAYLSLSLPLLYAALNGQAISGLAFLWKSIYVSITLSSGGSGGIITPLFVIGATAGAALAAPLGLPVSLAAALGMCAGVAAGANTPIAAILMGLEIFGSRAGLPVYLLSAVIPAFIIVGYRSVYGPQVVASPKSPLLPVQVGRSLEDIPESELAEPVEALLARWLQRPKALNTR